MKKFLIVLGAALGIAILLWAGLRIARAKRELAVAELLPRETLILAEAPDLNRSREQWHGSDLAAIWREPAVQNWLREPLLKIIPASGRSATEDFLRLKPTHLFLALTSLENNEPKFAGGFSFSGSTDDVRRFLDQREAALLAKNAGKIERGRTIYQEHEIATVISGRLMLAEVFDRDWFFVANDLPTLEALLDRADRRIKEKANSLGESDDFVAAMKQLPAEDAAIFFLNPAPFIEKLGPVFAFAGQNETQAQLQNLRTVKAWAGALNFEAGKMHDAIFVAMPQLAPDEKITNRLLSTADTDTFFYWDGLMRWQSNWMAALKPSTLFFLHGFGDAVTKAGVSANDLAAAFGDEGEIFGRWPTDVRLPYFLVALPVNDATRARKIAAAAGTAPFDGGAWTRTEKNGADFYSSPPLGLFIPIHFTFAVSDKIFVAGTDDNAVEALIAPPVAPKNGLENSAAFREATAHLPPGASGFSYLDTRAFFEKADAALRPLLMMGATLSPALGQKFDASKLPPAEMIAKHLSPVVMTQRYTGGGYLSESIGPITFDQAGIGLAAAIAAIYFQFHQAGNGTKLLPPPISSPATPSPSTSPF